MKRSRVLWLLLTACGLILPAIGCSNPQATSDKYFARGNAAFDTQKYPDAILAYRNALKADPLSAPTRQKLGQALEKVGDYNNSSREFVRAADLLPTDAKAQLQAAKALLATQHFEDSATRARRTIELEPRNAEAHILLGSALAGNDDFDGAMKQIQEALKIDPLSGQGHLNKAALLFGKGLNTEARGSFEEAIRLDPASISARLALATFHLNTGAIKEAEEAVRGALSIAPADLRPNRAMVAILLSSGRASEAEPYVKAAAAANGTPEAELGLVDYYLHMNRVEAATPILQRLLESQQLFAPASTRLAFIDYGAGRKDEAHKRLDEVLQKVPTSVEAATTKAQWLLAEGRYPEGLAMAQAAVKMDPQSLTGQFVLGRARSVTGDRAGAIDAFKEVLRLNPRVGAAQTELARLNLAAGKTDEGIQFAREAIKTQPKVADPRILLVRGLIARRDIERATTEMGPLTRALPDDPTVRALNGTLFALKKDSAGARREYEHALQADPGQLDALGGLSALDVQAGKLDTARQRIKIQLERSPKNAPLLLLAARTDLQAQDTAAAEQHLRGVIAADPSIMPAYELLARTYLQQGRLDEARKEFEHIAEREPNSVGAHTLVGIIYNMQNRLDEAEKAYRRALDSGPAAPVAANNLAYLYADRDHNLEEALALARAAAVNLKDNPAVMDTVGWVYYKKGEPNLAIPQFEASIQKDPQAAGYHYHLGLAYAKAGQAAKAKRALNEALRLNPKFDGAADARRALSTLQS